LEFFFIGHIYPLAIIKRNEIKMKNKTDLEKAKKMYFDYGQISFHMGREGVLKEYQSFNISSETENEWTNSYLKERLDNFDLNAIDENFQTFHIISSKSKFNFLNHFLIKIAKNLDNLTNKYIAVNLGKKLFNMVFEAHRRNKISTENRRNIINIVKLIHKKARTLSIPPNYKNPHFEKIYFDETIEKKLTQEQYTERKMIELERDLIKVNMFK